MNKDYYRIYLTKYERDVSELLFCYFLDKRITKKDLFSTAKNMLNKIAVHLGLKDNEIKMIWDSVVLSYTLLNKKVKKGVKKDRATIIRQYLPKLDIVAVLNKVEERKKTNTLLKLFAKKSPFYLCTSHKKCACGHQDYQGKIYINSNWREKVEKDAVPKIEAYIRNHKLRNVEWVINEPVYLIRRPNCKHQLINIPIEEVLSSSVNKLIDKYNFEPNGKKLNVYKFNQASRRKLNKRLNRLEKSVA